MATVISRSVPIQHRTVDSGVGQMAVRHAMRIQKCQPTPRSPTSCSLRRPCNAAAAGLSILGGSSGIRRGGCFASRALALGVLLLAELAPDNAQKVDLRKIVEDGNAAEREAARKDEKRSFNGGERDQSYEALQERYKQYIPFFAALTYARKDSSCRFKE